MKEKGLEVREARNGKGVFATQDWKAGETVIEIVGKRYHYETLLKRRGTFMDNCFRISENYYISPEGEWGEFLNHSCKPNSKLEKRGGKLFMVALGDIEKGDEMVFDYSTILGRDDIWTLKCNCGEKSCRGEVKNFTKLPKETLRKYIEQKILPGYIIDLGR